jgi:hypothetical protein
LVIFALAARFRLYYNENQLAHIMLSDLRQRELWPALLIPPMAFVFGWQIVLKSLGIVASILKSIFSGYPSSQISEIWVWTLAGYLSVPLLLVQGCFMYLALFALLGWFCAMRPRLLVLLVSSVVFFVANFIVVNLVSMPIQYGMAYAWMRNTPLLSLTVLLVLNTLTSLLIILIYLRVYRWALRRLRGPQFRRRMQAAMERAN